MRKRHKRKSRTKAPDDYFVAGHMEVARFGKIVTARSLATPDQAQELRRRMADNLPNIVAEIDKLVMRIASVVAKVSPESLLQRAFWEYASLRVGLGGHIANGSEEMVAMHMLDYVQSVAAAVKPIEPYGMYLDDAEWGALKEDVDRLFTLVSVDYQMGLTASRRVKDPNMDDDFEDFRFTTEVFWMNGRGKRYQAHERQALLDLLTPHSAEVTKLFGISWPELIDEIDKLLAKLTHGLSNAMEAFEQLRQDTLDRFAELTGRTGLTGTEALRDAVFEDPDLAARRDRVQGEIFGLDLFDVAKITCIPQALQDELSWSPGQEDEFFASGEFCGWPLRVLPTMKRPFLKVHGRVLCFDAYSLFDHFYRVVQRLIFRLDPAYKETWNILQKEVSERLPFESLERILPGSLVHRPVYYRHQFGQGKAEWYEADGILVYDDHLLVVEVKAGAFTYTSPATDLPAHIESLRGLALNPSAQGARFVDYLQSAAEVEICDADHKVIGTLRGSDFRHITVCAVTLDPFTELAARASNLRSLAVDPNAQVGWVLSIDDLRVYADVFDNPLVFLHFIEQRMRASSSGLVNLRDELDHLGLYIAQNNYSQYAAELVGNTPWEVNFDGFTRPVDEYFTAMLLGEKPTPPKQKTPHRVSQILEFLATSQMAGRSQIASYFLDKSGSARRDVAEGIEQQLSDARDHRAMRPMSTYGETRLTLFTWAPSAPRRPGIAVDYTRAVMAADGEKDRLLVELEFDSDAEISQLHWQWISMSTLSSADAERARAEGAMMRKNRLGAALEKRKVGRNEPCPCLSGKKYKSCCARASATLARPI